MSFTDLGLHPSLLKAITASGYEKPTPVQLAAIPAILAKHDVMAGAQTGTGKTAAFTLPILHQLLSQSTPPIQAIPLTKPAVTRNTISALILTPTRELAQQVFKNIETYAQYTNIKAALLYGGVSINPQIKAINAGASIIVATPGRLLDHLIKGSLTLNDLQYLVFDEADRMLDMGFKDEINRILNRVPPKRQTLLFSATFDDSIFKLSKTLLTDPELIEVGERNQAAADVEQLIYTVDADRKRELTSFLIGANNWQQVLIFTRTKKQADELAKEMCKDGIKTQSIHGDKSQGARDKALLEFKSGKIRALVATDVAARGIDIIDLQYVINYELPYVAEDYIHRIGRTGRAGKAGLALSLMSPEEEWLLKAVEEVTKTTLLPQWFAGYEPDPNKPAKNGRKPQRTPSKKSARNKALGLGKATRKKRNQ